ncbi:MAG: phosphate transport system regulatory protein PhoU [Alphaproteobacteria bacterium]|nr:MAG: phosphate transport system regulatory protein PhoU [Alphaproteobacteria bacterium]
MSQNHILSSFDEELNTLRANIVKMGILVEEQYKNALIALKEKDKELAERVRKTDRIIDQMDTEIEKQAIHMIALRSPVADDLRDIVSTIKISSGLERIGDYAKNLAKRVMVVRHKKTISVSSDLIDQMVSQIRSMITDVIDAYITRDIEKAIDVWQRDKAVDNLYNSLFRELLTYMMENPEYITPATHLLFIAKNIERAGDHATNIAELVYYINAGELLAHKRPKDDSSNYVEIETD